MNLLSGEGSTNNKSDRRYVMTAKPIDSSPRKMGREQTTEAMLGLQKELLEGYQQAAPGLPASSPR